MSINMPFDDVNKDVIILDQSTSLFRYRPLYAHQFDDEKRLLLEGKLLFSSPSTFNDPFDCKPNNMRFSDDINLWREYLTGAVDRLHSDFSDDEKHKWIKSKIELFSEVNLEEVHRVMEARFNKYGVCCFTKDPMNLLMWSHYGRGHKGICLQFDHEDSFFKLAVNVVYEKDFPILFGPTEIDEEWIRVMLYTKYESWIYEEEWRIILLDKANKEIEYPQGSLKGIILGCEIDNDIQQQIVDVVAEMKSIPRLYKATKSKEQYGIYLSPLGVKRNGEEIVWPELEESQSK